MHLCMDSLTEPNQYNMEWSGLAPSIADRKHGVWSHVY